MIAIAISSCPADKIAIRSPSPHLSPAVQRKKKDDIQVDRRKKVI
jgi:hypothetical protein